MMKRILIFCLTIGSPFLLSAQMCTGRLGTPTATINFGSQNIPSNISSNTSYQLSAGCPSKGQYSLQSLIFNCASGDWHTLVADHTSGDVNGMFMLVNAAPVPSDLSAAQTNTSPRTITLNWTASTDNVKVSNYRLYRAKA